MDDVKFILALMRENYDSIGFLPNTTVENRYIAKGQYVLQRNERGVPVGYILHGALHAGKSLVISQHCIEAEKRLHGYGEAAFNEVIERARQANCRSIRLRCAEDLPSNAFWQAQGLQLIATTLPENARKRAIHVYRLNLWPSLWFDDAEPVHGERERKLKWKHAINFFV